MGGYYGHFTFGTARPAHAGDDDGARWSAGGGIGAEMRVVGEWIRGKGEGK
jgi:hypothetical protein